MFYFFLIDLLDGIGEVVVEIDPDCTDKDDLCFDGSTDVVGQTVAIEEDHFSDIKVFDVVQRVAVETFNEDFAGVIPEIEGVGSGDEGDPLLLGMQGEGFDLIRNIEVQIEQNFVFARHG